MIVHNKDGTVEIVTDSGMSATLAADTYHWLVEVAGKRERSIEDQLQWMYDDLQSRRVTGVTFIWRLQ